MARIRRQNVFKPLDTVTKRQHSQSRRCDRLRVHNLPGIDEKSTDAATLVPPATQVVCSQGAQALVAMNVAMSMATRIQPIVVHRALRSLVAAAAMSQQINDEKHRVSDHVIGCVSRWMNASVGGCFGRRAAIGLHVEVEE